MEVTVLTLPEVRHPAPLFPAAGAPTHQRSRPSVRAIREVDIHDVQ